jgi:hypothetical protein
MNKYIDNIVSIQKGGGYKKTKIPDMINRIKMMMSNYGRLDQDYIKKHNEVIELFNGFKALVGVVEDKAENDKLTIKKLSGLIKRTKKNKILDTEKRQELRKVQNNIMDEYSQLKKDLNGLNINIDQVIANVSKKNKYKKYYTLGKNSEKKKNKVHIKAYKRSAPGRSNKKILVKSHNRVISPLTPLFSENSSKYNTF